MALIRTALGGPPRRLSAAFLHSERCSLHAHRVACRTFYEQRMKDEALLYPPDIPEQVNVGQTVTARHPRLRTLHNGDVLTANIGTYMVQFHRAELGVAKVHDTDVALSAAPAAVLPAAPAPVSAPVTSEHEAATSHRGGADTPSAASGPVRCCSQQIVHYPMRTAMLTSAGRACNLRSQSRNDADL
jgi:DIRP